MKNTEASRIAVVGLGPRGLGALEALASALPRNGQPLMVDVFDTFPAVGAGPNFDPRESEVCRLNIPLRDIDLRPPGFGTLGDFSTWLGEAAHRDAFPTRAELGRYLVARFDDLVAHGALTLTHWPVFIDALQEDTKGWKLRSGGDWFGPYREVLLTLGQPEIETDDQLEEWHSHAQRSDGVLATAYPARELLETAAEWTGLTVAIRGLALSAIDVIRTLTVGQGGRFHDGAYSASGREPSKIIPFSLDGQPPYPKPKTQEIDALFEPSPRETETFRELMTRAAQAEPTVARGLIDEALLPVVRRILITAGAADEGGKIGAWLDAEWETPGTQESVGSIEALRHGIAMAEGRQSPTIGYAVGQIWRKWQDEIRNGFNSIQTPCETAEMLVGFDEGLKRYSYGPPVSSCHEILALVETGLVDLAWSANPEIRMVDQGWKLEAQSGEVLAAVMVDSVLPSPDLSTVTASLVSELVESGRLCPIADGLGARIAADGTILGQGGVASSGLAFLGRLALGSVIAADSLHDCFGEASYRWAEGVVERIAPAAVVSGS